MWPTSGAAPPSAPSSLSRQSGERCLPAPESPTIGIKSAFPTEKGLCSRLRGAPRFRRIEEQREFGPVPQGIRQGGHQCLAGQCPVRSVPEGSRSPAAGQGEKAEPDRREQGLVPGPPFQRKNRLRPQVGGGQTVMFFSTKSLLLHRRSREPTASPQGRKMRKAVNPPWVTAFLPLGRPCKMSCGMGSSTGAGRWPPRPPHCAPGPPPETIRTPYGLNLTNRCAHPPSQSGAVPPPARRCRRRPGTRMPGEKRHREASRPSSPNGGWE